MRILNHLFFEVLTNNSFSKSWNTFASDKILNKKQIHFSGVLQLLSFKLNRWDKMVNDQRGAEL